MIHPYKTLIVLYSVIGFLFGYFLHLSFLPYCIFVFVVSCLATLASKFNLNAVDEYTWAFFGYFGFGIICHISMICTLTLLYRIYFK